jgi:hypothetical protein
VLVVADEEDLSHRRFRLRVPAAADQGIALQRLRSNPTSRRASRLWASRTFRLRRLLEPRPPRTGCQRSRRRSLPAIAAATTTAATAAAAATTTAAAATTAATAAATAAAALLTLFSFVDAERSAVEELAVHFGDCLLCLFRCSHRHEGEAARLAGLAVRGDMNVAHLAKASESGSERVGRRVEGQVTYVETISHVLCSIRVSARQNQTLPSDEPSDRGRAADVIRAHAS